MSNRVRTTLLNSIILTLTLAACGVTPTPKLANPDKRPEADYKVGRIPGTDTSISHHNFSKAQINALRTAVAKLKFPLPDGTVDHLLPVQGAHSGAEIYDLFPNKDGCIAVFVWRYVLSFDYILLVRQGQYADKTPHPVRSYFRDEDAKIVRRDKLPKHLIHAFFPTSPQRGPL